MRAKDWLGALLGLGLLWAAPLAANAQDEYPVDEPVYEEPAYEEPAYEEPAYAEPVYEQPQAEVDPTCAASGIYDYDQCLQFLSAPPPEEPVYEEPVVEEPVYEEPAFEEPVFEESPPEEPVFDEPLPEEPVFEEPVVEEEPVFDEPLPDEPVFEEPAIDEPVFDEPLPDEPVFEEPVAEEPAFEEPLPDEPVFEEEVPEEPAVDEPIVEEPVAEEFPEEEPVIDEEVPTDETAIDEELPTDETAIDEETPTDEPAIDEELPTDETAIEEETPTDEPVIDEETPTDETAIEEEPLPDEPVTEEEVAEEPFESEEPFPTNEEGMPIEVFEELPPDVTAEEIAPVFDSSKEVDTDTSLAPEGPEYIPATDFDAQNYEAPELIDPIADYESEPLPEAPAFQAPDNVTIINETNNTYMFEVNNQVIINNYYDDQNRMVQQGDEVYYERFGDTYSEFVIRPDGSQVITLRDRYGNIISRTLYDAYGNEYVLAYYDPSYGEDERMYWGDVGSNLPPLIIDIAINAYIFYYDRYDVNDLEVFFRLPPVEPVRRLYTIDEVKRSARLRDSLPRVEISNLRFATGSAQISKSQAGALKKLATAMLAILYENPGETFLIEGHTDAVGDAKSNLRLSDARAAAVARALTRYYGVPPENLTTQGYGERFLKIDTKKAEPLNRRVTVRRITALITRAMG